MPHVKIDLSKCTGCKICVDVCFTDVIHWDASAKRPIAKYPEECATCNWCEIKCVAKAIQVIPGNPAPYPEYYPKAIYPNS